MTNALKVLYDARDAMADTLFGDDAIACKSGCSYCCRHAVFVSMAEARMIKDAMDEHMRSIDMPEADRMWDHVRDHLQVQCHIFAGGTPKAYRQRCLFLNPEGKCRIYSHRPFVCRWYNSQDAGACERDEPVNQAHAPFDKMFMRLSQIAWAQADHGQDLSPENIRSSTTHWFMPAALLHVVFNNFDGAIPEQYSHGEYHGAGA